MLIFAEKYDRNKEEKRKMKRIISILLYMAVLLPLAAQPPKHEVRAAWITAVYGLDWPQTRTTSPEGIRKQQAELIEILDRLKAANFNTVLFQTRTRGDVLYKSAIEPYNFILTGKVGGDPGYDPLAFAIAECHKRGMECHAWMVTIPLGNRKHVAALGKESVTKKKRAICVPYKREYFLNPGHPQTKEYLMSLVREVVERYDVDGIHFDYLRYPENAPRFPDSYDYRKYSKGRSLAQWRRDNLTEIVRYIYKGVKTLPATPPVAGMPSTPSIKTCRVGWARASRTRFIRCSISVAIISIPLPSTGRNKVTDAKSFPVWASTSSTPAKGTGRWTRLNGRCTLSAPTVWRARHTTA